MTTTLVEAPGLYDIDETLYHADTHLAPTLGRSLSASGAKSLLRSPARFKWERDNGARPDTATFDTGHAAHRFILRKGNDVGRVHADTWRTNTAKAEAAALRAAHRVPLLVKDYLAALDMAKAVRRHRNFGRLFDDGAAEQSAYWIDDATGVTCRARADWLHPHAVIDVKTAADASPAGFAKAVANFRYDLQAVVYGEAFGADLPFVFVVVETAPPHFCAAYVLPAEALAIGRNDWHRALAMFAECESTGVWPSYSEEIETLTLPGWFYRQSA